MADLAVISTAQGAIQSLSGLILVTPLTNIGIKANVAGSKSFLFHRDGVKKITLQSDITDHYVENNSAIQDQIARKPEKYQSYGFIGELNDVPLVAPTAVNQTVNKLLALSVLSPQLSVTALLALNTAAQLAATVAAAVNAGVTSVASLSGSQLGAPGSTQAAQNKQQTAFNQFYGYWQANMLFQVQTPWAIFQNMAIETLVATEEEDTTTVTEFEISFKAMRFANTVTLTGVAVPGAVDAPTAQQQSTPVNLGSSTPAASTPLSAVP